MTYTDWLLLVCVIVFVLWIAGTWFAVKADSSKSDKQETK